MGNQLCLSTTYHPQTNGQSERTIQHLEDLLRSCALEFGGHWDETLPIVKFTYNNSYQRTIGMTPFRGFVWKEVSNLFARPIQKTKRNWAQN